MLRKTFLLILVLVIVVEFAKAASECEQRRRRAQRSQRRGTLGGMIYECEEDGSYKMLQCRTSTGLCRCVDPETGERISEDSRDANLNCHEHMTLSDCERKRKKAKRSQDNGMLGGMIYECEEDGSYKMLQCGASTGLCCCVDPETGEQISDDSRDANFSCQEYKNLSECQFKRLKAKRSQDNGMLGVMIYECEEDGSYKKMQCPSSTGLCHCVHPETGEQISDDSRDADFKCE